MDKRLILLIALALVGSGSFAAYRKLMYKPEGIKYAIKPNAPIKTGDSIAYEDNTAGASRWKWDFGDGEFSADQQGHHTYLAPGTYTVTLTAFGSFGMQQKSDKVNVLASDIVAAPPPVATTVPAPTAKVITPTPAPVQKPVVTASAKPMPMPPAQHAAHIEEAEARTPECTQEGQFAG